MINVKEIWKPIKGYEGLYEISNQGRVKSLQREVIRSNGFKQIVTEKIITLISSKITTRHPNPMFHVELWKDNKRKTYFIHRLVAEHFIPNLEGKPQVNHIDGNRYNNTVENLEWVTGSENMIHAYKTGLTQPRGQKPIKRIDLKTNEVVLFKNVYDAARAIQAKPCAIRNALKGRCLTSNGYKWEYVV